MIKRTKYFGDYARASFFIAFLKLEHGIKGEMEIDEIGGWIVTWIDPDGKHRF